MPVVVIAGALFTVKLEAGDVSAQIKDGTIDRAINVINEKTLGPNTTPVATDVEDTVNINGLYDGASGGWYEAIWAASDTLSAIDVEITDGPGGQKWTGALMPASLGASFGAETSSEASASFSGRLVRAPEV